MLLIGFEMLNCGNSCVLVVLVPYLQDNQGPFATTPVVRTLAPGEKPKFETSLPETVILDEKQTIELVAEFKGKPTPKVKWYRNGKELFDGKDNVTITTKDGTSTLVIKNPKANVDDGLYACHIENEVGHAVTETQITFAEEKEVR